MNEHELQELRMPNPTNPSAIAGGAPTPAGMTAPMMLEMAATHIANRAATRDKESGERTMRQTVGAFNAIYGTSLTEEQGWQFMTLLKMVRGANGKVNPDDYQDGAAYFALAGEAALSERS